MSSATPATTARMTSADAPMSQARNDRADRSGTAAEEVIAGECKVNGADGTTVCRSSSARNARNARNARYARYAERTTANAACRSASSTAAGVPSRLTNP
jgi:hypothetical protein